ncbi:MAG: histidine phosphatase family protein [Actinomycetes bacterium]
MTERTIVHLLRHGEVHNPEEVLYGRLPGYVLSELGERMANRVAEAVEGRDIVAVWASPLVRAQQTAQPTALAKDLQIVTDQRLIEAANVFEGKSVTMDNGAFKQPRNWKYLVNPMRPSWGEPYKAVEARMREAIIDARGAAQGHEILLVSHQLPVWTSRLSYEGRHLWHDPRKRQCNLASLTSLAFDGDRLRAIVYTEPAADLVALAHKGAGA